MPPPVRRNEPDVNVFLNSLLRFYGQAVNWNGTNLNEIEQNHRHGIEFLDSLQMLALQAEDWLVHSRDFAELSNALYEMVEILQQILARLEHLQLHFQARLNPPSFVCPTENRPGPGRPKLLVTLQQLEYLWNLGFSWEKIAQLLRVSARSIRNIRHELGMPVG